MENIEDLSKVKRKEKIHMRLLLSKQDLHITFTNLHLHNGPDKQYSQLGLELQINA